MLAALKGTLLDLLASKKFLTFVGICIAWVAMRLGFDVDQATATHFVEVGAALLIGQGVADHGKAAAQVAANDNAAAREHAAHLLHLQVELEKARALSRVQDPAPAAA